MKHSYQHDKNAEIKYLQNLINKFGNSNLQASKAIEKIYTRYEELKQKRLEIINHTKQSKDGYYDRCLKIHSYLYKDILNNAGQFRQINDPNKGNVYFGGISCKTMRDKFTGTNPNFIESELKEAFNILFNSDYEPLEKSIRFYAEFVAIHPFYDANGRIGRYIVDIFLQTNNYYVDWQSLNKQHGKFLRKLNFCHSVRSKHKLFLYCTHPSSYCSQQNIYWMSVRDKYIGYLLKFWRKFVSNINDLEDD